MITSSKSTERVEELSNDRTAEDEAFEEIHRKQAAERETALYRLPARPKTAEEAFDGWSHSHRPNEYWIERKAFLAGWAAGVRNEWAKERND